MKSDLVPRRVVIQERKEGRQSLNYWCIFDHWTPFEAACLILGFTPSSFKPGDTSATAFLDLGHDGVMPDSYDPAENYGAMLRNTAITLVRNNPGVEKLVPAKIVAWAIHNRFLDAASPLARAVSRPGGTETETSSAESSQRSPGSEDPAVGTLSEMLRASQAEVADLREKLLLAQRASKETNKRFTETREQVLAAALHRLANEITTILAAQPPETKDTRVFSSSGRVIATRLAHLVHDNRVYYGFPIEDEKPACASIEDLLKDVLSGKRWTR